MRIKLGDIIRLNRNIGRHKKGDIFTVDGVDNDIVSGYCHKTDQRIVLSCKSSSVSILKKELGIYV